MKRKFSTKIGACLTALFLASNLLAMQTSATNTGVKLRSNGWIWQVDANDWAGCTILDDKGLFDVYGWDGVVYNDNFVCSPAEGQLVLVTLQSNTVSFHVSCGDDADAAQEAVRQVVENYFPNAADDASAAVCLSIRSQSADVIDYVLSNVREEKDGEAVAAIQKELKARNLLTAFFGFGQNGSAQTIDFVNGITQYDAKDVDLARLRAYLEEAALDCSVEQVEDTQYRVVPRATLSTVEHFNLMVQLAKALDLMPEAYVLEDLTQVFVRTLPICSGDVNSDGFVDIGDAILLSRYVAEDASVSISADGLAAADVVADGALNGADINAILRMIANHGA